MRTDQNDEVGSTGWRSPSNIALIKYWGKRKGQVPENPSISITLSNSFTETLLDYSPAKGSSGSLKGFLFEGKENSAFAGRISRYLESVAELYPFLVDFDISLESSNSFPHSSGIASSASAMSSLAMCLTSMERQLFNSPSDEDSFLRKASYAARMGSGSAARSVYPGYVLWGRTESFPYSADEFAVPVNDDIHDIFRHMGDAILIVDESPKPVSSSAGHALMTANPWSPARYEQAREHTGRLISVLAAGDAEEFVRIVEKEAMTLHSLMMSSDPGYILLKPGTLEIIERVRRFRSETSVPVAFTLDAGPNVHLIYPVRFRESVKELVEQQLLQYCSGERWIDDGTGEGPVAISPAVKG
jgi:diphosphomevalonate decarboxylase